MKVLLLLCFVAFAHSRQISFTNRCSQDVWVSPLTNAQGPPHPDGIRRLANGATHVYQISDAGWGGRFWPKTGCDANGQNCEVGQCQFKICPLYVE